MRQEHTLFGVGPDTFIVWTTVPNTLRHCTRSSLTMGGIRGRSKIPKTSNSTHDGFENPGMALQRMPQRVGKLLWSCGPV
jgi:hypothetical protein